MFARILGRGATPILRPGLHGLNGAHQVQARNAATLKALQIRMRAIKNMQKITKAMKMVAAAKMRKDQKRMEIGLPFAQPVQDLFARLPREEKPGNPLFCVITSDKGLCGGVNSAVTKQVRLSIADEEAKGHTVKTIIVGGKGVAGLKRLYGDRFSSTFEDTSRAPWSFGTASMIAERIIAAKPARLKVFHNIFKSMVIYNTTIAHTITRDEAMTIDKSEWTKAMDVYSFEPSIYEVWDDLQEWYYANVVFAAYLNSTTAETSQRMNAMENASKNAGEILEKVSLQFNRARQAKITTELCEIISGASAV